MSALPRDTKSTATPIPVELAVGDVVFIRIRAKPFHAIATVTRSWTNHVAVVLDVEGKEPLIGESRFPFSGTTTLSRFLARSEGGRYALARLHHPLTVEQQVRLKTAAQRRHGIHYDTGFDLHSSGLFCSRYVSEVLADATGIQVGEVQTFADLLVQQPDANLAFWKLWYFGRIPWTRETVSPASLLRSPKLQLLHDSAMAVQPAH